MVKFSATIEQFAEHGDKTGWMYIVVPAKQAAMLHSSDKKSFRVKGTIDAHAIAAVALLPMGEGNYMLPFNGTMRKATRKRRGDSVKLVLAYDKQELEVPADLAECLDHEPDARAFFESLRPSHRNYFLKWLTGVKTDAARAKRIEQTITALARKQDFVAMIRSMKKS